MLSARHVYNRSFLLNYRKPNFTRTSVRRLSLMLRNVRRIRYPIVTDYVVEACNNNTREWSLWNFKRRANAVNSFFQRKSIVTRKCLHRSCSWIPICVTRAHSFYINLLCVSWWNKCLLGSVLSCVWCFIVFWSLR